MNRTAKKIEAHREPRSFVGWIELLVGFLALAAGEGECETADQCGGKTNQMHLHRDNLLYPQVKLSQLKTELKHENQEEIDVARHPDNIYYIYLDTNINITEYSMIRLIKKRGE